MPVAEAVHGRSQPNPVYPANLREYARRLHQENGWSPYRIRKAMLLRGIDPLPSEHAVRSWVDDDYREEHLLRSRRFGPPGPRKVHTWRLRLARMEELRGIKLSYTAIAALMSHDFEDIELTEEQARSILQGKVHWKTARRLLYPRAA